MPSLEDRFAGCLLGLALGDAVGAPHEGSLPARWLWKLLGLGRGNLLRWTDDTQMAVVLARSLIEHGCVESDALARAWAHEARWTRGYGPGTLKTLARIRKGEDWRSANRAAYAGGSYGNGAAMRTAPIGLLYHRDPEALTEAARLAASITHAHPLGIEGAVLLARATAQALEGDLDLAALRQGCQEEAFVSRLARAEEALPTDQVARVLGNSIRADESVVTALHAAHRFHDFTQLLEFVRSVGGDVDTIGAMAGAVFGARQGVGALPADLLARLEARDAIEATARRLHAAWATRPPRYLR